MSVCLIVFVCVRRQVVSVALVSEEQKNQQRKIKTKIELKIWSEKGEKREIDFDKIEFELNSDPFEMIRKWNRVPPHMASFNPKQLIY